jgi:glycerol-3-phosphate dehydrogenase
MINISGGKWTTYRKMAQEVILKAHYEGGLAYTRCQTETMKLHGWMKKWILKIRCIIMGDVRHSFLTTPGYCN